MENAPVIHIAANKVLPEYRERYMGWVFEAYWPLLMKSTWLKAIDTFSIVKENPEYNITMTIFYFDSLNSSDNYRKSAEYAAWVKDLATTWQPARAEIFWRARYEQIASFKNTLDISLNIKGEKTPNPPVILLEGYRLSPETEEKYNTWFAKWGHEVYIPLLMKLSGLKQYVQYRLASYNITDGLAPRRPVEYPPYLNIFTFENLKACEEYEKSLELAALKGATQALLPRGLDYKWYVQYQLMKSWRK
jgi:hypothetical protein